MPALIVRADGLVQRRRRKRIIADFWDNRAKNASVLNLSKPRKKLLAL